MENPCKRPSNLVGGPAWLEWRNSISTWLVFNKMQNTFIFHLASTAWNLTLDLRQRVQRCRLEKLCAALQQTFAAEYNIKNHWRSNSQRIWLRYPRAGNGMWSNTLWVISMDDKVYKKSVSLITFDHRVCDRVIIFNYYLSQWEASTSPQCGYHITRSSIDQRDTGLNPDWLVNALACVSTGGINKTDFIQSIACMENRSEWDTVTTAQLTHIRAYTIPLEI